MYLSQRRPSYLVGLPAYPANRLRVLPKLPKLLESIASADVCIVGGGITGVSTALHLVEFGYSVILFEAHQVGHGATSRSGGQIVTGFCPDFCQLADTYGDDIACRLWSRTIAAANDLAGRIASENIECHYRPGYLFTALTEEHAAVLARMAVALNGAFPEAAYQFLDENDQSHHRNASQDDPVKI